MDLAMCRSPKATLGMLMILIAIPITVAAARIKMRSIKGRFDGMTVGLFKWIVTPRFACTASCH